MSLYCIGDLHGRYDLFTMALEKIKFNYEEDKLYILGDIMDVNYGAIQIFQHFMQYPHSFELILGNHEINFINMTEAYDIFMLDDDLRLKVKDVIDNYIENYESISYIVISRVRKKDLQFLRDSRRITQWCNKSRKRKLLFEAILNLIEYLNCDDKKFEHISRVLLCTNGIFKTKQFVKELLEIDANEYLALKEYIFSREKEIKFSYFDREFWLTHCIPVYTDYLKHIPNMEVSEQYVIFGHDPVPQIHRELSDRNFNFNYREIFSYIDRFDNHYFNLDMGDNVAAVLRLDDFEEFYVMKYKREVMPGVIPPTEPASNRKVGYKIVDSSLPVYKSKKGFSFINYKNLCMEYLIGLNKFKKKIYYKRVDYIDCLDEEVIEDWYDNQSIEEIIEKVRNDFNRIKDTEEMLSIEKMLRKMDD